MKITLVGIGGGTFDSVTMQGAEALHEATLIIGAKRLLEKLAGISVRKIVSQCIKSVRFYQCLKQQKNKISHLYTAVTPGFIPAPLHCAACSMNATSNTP